MRLSYKQCAAECYQVLIVIRGDGGECVRQLANVNPEQGTLPIETLILCVAKALVVDHQSVTVDAADDELGTTTIITVARADLGKIIGK